MAARVIGEAARWPGREQERLLSWLYGLGVGWVGFMGFLAGYSWGKQDLVLQGAIAAAGLVVGGGGWWVIRRLAGKWLPMLRGKRGEEDVAKVLGCLPDGFTVFHSIDLGAGDIDHVVVGPTGVFCIDTKSWVGTVMSDGKGELLQSGKKFPRPVVRRHVAKIALLRERVAEAMGGRREAGVGSQESGIRGQEPKAPWFQGSIVFARGRLQKKLELQNVDVMPLERLLDYLQARRPSRTLGEGEVGRVVAGLERVVREGLLRESEVGHE